MPLPEWWRDVQLWRQVLLIAAWVTLIGGVLLFLFYGFYEITSF